ncbi:siroheme synthase CysG [Candidatus Spongiihabitans sp.]|uniref:siroheme synthase CysG n=1 Tax=Candidatus Spongiihabitans sp. TaxID=3101308 RepID=UPI003C6FCA5C
MKYLPLMHNFERKTCLIVGGGKVALRRAKSVLAAGGIVDVIAPTCLPELFDLVHQYKSGQYKNGQYQAEDIDPRYALVIAATNDRQINQAIAQQCKAKNILVNVVDDSSLCDVTFPAIVDRNPILVAISSGSASPQFSKLLRERINTFIPNGYGKLAELFGRYRKRVKSSIPKTKDRAVFWNKVVHSYIAESALSGNLEQAEAQLKGAIDNHEKLEQCGEVYLIGAGPGDPDLLTLRALRLLQQSEVIVYDRLVAPEILNRLEQGKDLIYVGKQRANHSVAQPQINELLIRYASQGRRVARLKGGDPFIFGRGGEEIENLAAHNIPFQVIPGITAANGCASYAGIPLTHRDHAQSVRFVTGQLQNGAVNLNWAELTAADQTLVFYMGLQGLPIICENLIKHGAATNTPAALIEKGTTLQQKVHISTLEELAALLESIEIHAPTLTIVGSVVNLHASLHWFNKSVSS